MDYNCFVYFVRNPKTRQIKIGKTKHPEKRLKQLELATRNKLEVLLVLPYMDLESSMHSRFAALREEGEWFSPGDDLVDFVLTTKIQTEVVPEIVNITTKPSFDLFSILVDVRYYVIQVLATALIFFVLFIFSIVISFSEMSSQQDIAGLLFFLGVLNSVVSVFFGRLAAVNSEK